MASKNGKNGKELGRPAEPRVKISKLGKQLREISDKALASGTKILSPDEIHQVVHENRGGH